MRAKNTDSKEVCLCCYIIKLLHLFLAFFLYFAAPCLAVEACSLNFAAIKEQVDPFQLLFLD